MLELVDTSIVNVAIPHMMGNLGATLDEIAWVSTGYIVANVIILPLTSWLSDRFGRRNYYTGSIILFTIASFFCGNAHTLEALVGWRVVQGIGGGALISTAQAILFDVFPLRRARQGHGHLRHGRHGRPHARPHAGRLDHRQLLVALDLLHQHPARRCWRHCSPGATSREPEHAAERPTRGLARARAADRSASARCRSCSSAARHATGSSRGRSSEAVVAALAIVSFIWHELTTDIRSSTCASSRTASSPAA